MRRSEKQQAIKLRVQGKSYNEILRILHIPSKGTLSYWFRNLKLPVAARRRLAHNILLARERGLFRYNDNRTRAILAENTKIHQEAASIISKLTPRELLIVGVALYWGEGYKSGKHPRLSLSNSDPKLIALYMRFLREVLRVSDDRIRTHLHIHPNVDRERAVQFWAHVTRIPSTNFRSVNQVSRASQGKRLKRSLPVGTLDVRVHSRPLYFKIRGLIEGLARQV